MSASPIFRRHYCEADESPQSRCYFAFDSAASGGGNLFIANDPLRTKHVFAHDEIRHVGHIGRALGRVRQPTYAEGERQERQEE